MRNNTFSYRNKLIYSQYIAIMDSEDETMPYLKLLTENSGNYLIQNNYELQDCLSVEPIFTEIETETWSSECFPILLNSSSANESHMKGLADHIIAEKQGSMDQGNLNGHIIVSHLSNTEEKLDVICQKENIPISSDNTENITLPQDSALHNDIKIFNHSDESQQGKQKRTILLLTNGNTYEISYSDDKLIDPNQIQDFNEESNSLDDDTNEINKQIIRVRTQNEHVQHEDVEKNSSTFEYLEKPDCNDPSDWNEFYSIVTAMKCKVCSWLCENSMEITDHLKRIHGDLMKSKQAADKKENRGRQKIKMKSLLNINSSAEKNVTIFLCSICNKIFERKELLMDHLEIHNSEPNISGDSDENSPTKTQKETPIYPMRNLARSLLKKQQKAMRKVKCSVKGCLFKFSNTESKLRHEECHVPNMKQFQCPECREKFPLWRICSKHLWTCHKIDAGLYSCSICDKYKSYSPAIVMRHMDIHNSEKPFICPDCGKGFKQLNQLRNHRVIHRSGEQVASWLTTKKCTICERFFANGKSLKRHIESVHEKLKPYICNVCGHKTTRKSMLELHLRLHTGDKPHHCPHCTYRTGDHNSLRKHVMKHYGFMQYSCPHCKYQSIQSSAYKNHLVTRHPGSKEIFQCGYCTFASVKFDSYLTHVKCHEYNEKNRKNENTTEHSAMNGSISDIGTEDQEDSETQIYSHLPDNEDYLEEIEDTGNVTISAVDEIKLAQ